MDGRAAAGASSDIADEGTDADLKVPQLGIAVICFLLFLTLLDNIVISATASKARPPTVA
jgi:hypothetical protein